MFPHCSPENLSVFFIKILPPIFFRIFIYSILVGFSITFFRVIFDPGVIKAPTMKKAALEGSPATLIFFE